MNKNDIIKNGVYKDFLEIKKGFNNSGYVDSNKVESYDGIFDEETIKNCFKIYNANRQRKRNGLNEMISWLFTITKLQASPNEEDRLNSNEFKLIFGTLTFTDEILQKTSPNTRRRYVARFLNQYAIEYMANIDFGEENEREHYHFVALVNRSFSKNSWKYGYDYYRNIKLDISALKKAKNYLLKINNHSYKESTRQERILKSRKLSINSVILIQNEEEFERFKIDIKHQLFYA